MTTALKIPKRYSDNTVLLLVGLAVAVVHVMANGQYGFHRDELDILMSARQLDWGYVNYPPLTPLIARMGLTLFGDSLPWLRLFSALGQGAAVVLAGLMARDFGGRLPAQVLAALAVAISPVGLMAGTLLQYMAFDYVWWVLLAFFVVRVLATDDPRWWLGAGAAVGLGMMTKYTILFFVAGLVAAVLVTSTRRALRSRYLWFGVGIALLIYLPNLIWQVQHEFISLRFLSEIHARDVAWGRAEGYLPKQIYENANPFILPLWVAGLLFCLVLPAGRRFRAVGWMFVVTFVLFMVADARSYYLGPVYAMLIAAGAAWWEGWLAVRQPAGRRAGWATLWGLVAVGGVAGVVLIKPIAPINSPLWQVTSEINHEVVEMVGWPDLVENVAAIYDKLPTADKPGAAILAGNYGEAGALDLYGPRYGLPRVISGANSLWARGYGDPPPEPVIVVGFERSYATALFKTCQPAGFVANQYNVKNEESTRHTGLYVCRDPRQPWPVLWERMQWFQ